MTSKPFVCFPLRLSFLRIVTAVLWSVIGIASADQSGDFTYTDKGSSIAITDYPTTATGALTIPGTIAGKPVTEIGGNAFLGCGELTSITLPSTVTEIGNQAFASCVKATSINIPAGVTAINYAVFLNCRALASVTIPAGVTLIDTSAFQECKALTTFVMPDSVSLLGDGIFYACDNLASITLSKNITLLPNYGFYACFALQSLTVPASVTQINAHIFDYNGTTELLFKGNAPTVNVNAFTNANSGLQVKFYNGKTGFTTPSWQNLPATNIGDEPLPEIDLFQPSTSALTDGASRNFGSVTIGEQTPLEFTITSSGTGELTDLAITKGGDAPSDFIITPLGSATLAAGNSTTFQVAFKPTAAGARAATLLITSNDADENPFEIALTGTGISPVPEISISSKGKLTDGDAKVSFGTAIVDGKKVTRSFTIRNTGKGKLTGLSIKLDGKHAKDFTVSKPAKTSLDPDGTTTFKVSFKARAKGTRKAAIHVRSNDADENPFDIKLIGEGAAK